MGKTSIRIWIAVGIIVMACGIIGYTLLFQRAKTFLRKESQKIEANQDTDQGEGQVGHRQAVKVVGVDDALKTNGDKASASKENLPNGPGSQGDEESLLASARSALNNTDGRERAMAAVRLRHATSEEAVDLLYKFLDDEDNQVTFHALSSLTIMGAKNSNLKNKIYTILLEKANDKECSERGNALIFATQVGNDDKILNIITNYIDEGEAGQYFAAKALAGIATPECIGYLQKILNTSQSPEIYHSILNTLSMIDSEAAANILEEKLNAKNTENSATLALAQWDLPKYNQILLRAIENNTLDKETIAIVAQNPAGPGILEEIVKDNTLPKDETLSLLKIYAESVPLARDDIRSITAQTVQPLLESPDKDIQIQAIRIMGSGTWEQRDMASMLAPKLKSPDKEIRLEALKAYRVYLTPDDYKTVLPLIWDEDETIRRYAFGFTEQFFDESDRPLLEESLAHKDEAIRKRASEILN